VSALPDTQDPIMAAVLRNRPGAPQRAAPAPAAAPTLAAPQAPDPIMAAVLRNRPIPTAPTMGPAAPAQAPTPIQTAPTMGPDAPTWEPPAPIAPGSGIYQPPAQAPDPNSIGSALLRNRELNQQAEQAGFFGRTGAAIRTAVGEGIDASTANVDRLVNATAQPGDPHFGPSTVGQEMLGVDQRTRDIAQRAGLGSKVIAGAAALPTTLLDPVAIGPMKLAHGAGPAAVEGFAPIQALLGGIEQKAGPQAAAAVKSVIEGQVGVGSFAGLHAAASYPDWATNPEGGVHAVAAATEGGVEAGTLFGAAGPLAKILGRPERAPYQNGVEARTRPASPTMPQDRAASPAPESAVKTPPVEQPPATPPAEPADGAMPGWMTDNAKATEAAMVTRGLADRAEELLASGKTAQETADALGVTREDIQNFRIARGIPSQTISGPMGAASQPNPDFAAWVQKKRSTPIQEPPHVPQPEEAARQEVPPVRGEEPQEQAQGPDAIPAPGRAAERPDGAAAPEVRILRPFRSAEEVRAAQENARAIPIQSAAEVPVREAPGGGEAVRRGDAQERVQEPAQESVAQPQAQGVVQPPAGGADRAEVLPEQGPGEEQQQHGRVLSAETGPFAAEAFRGSVPGRTTLEGAEYFTPSESVARSYAGGGGQVVRESLRFERPLRAKNWMDAKRQLGVPMSTTMLCSIGPEGSRSSFG